MRYPYFGRFGIPLALFHYPNIFLTFIHAARTCSMDLQKDIQNGQRHEHATLACSLGMQYDHVQYSHPSLTTT
jgi:hypothetical protein